MSSCDTQGGLRNYLFIYLWFFHSDGQSGSDNLDVDNADGHGITSTSSEIDAENKRPEKGQDQGVCGLEY